MQSGILFDKKIDEYNEKNFIVHNGNKRAFDFIKTLKINDVFGVFLIVGASKSGKSYICSIWQSQTNAFVIDKNIFDLDYLNFVKKISEIVKENQCYLLEDIDKFIQNNENKILYLFNLIMEKKCILLLTSKENIENFAINDLKSRFLNIPTFKLEELDNISKKQIILKLLTDRQMQISNDILDFVCEKITGNYETIFNFVKNFEKMVESGDIKKVSINNIKKLI